MTHNRKQPEDERGQVTILMVVVFGLGVACLLGLATIGEAMVHRARARTAADTIALSTGHGGDAAEPIIGWYQSQGARVEIRSDYARVESGPSQAAAWVATTTEVPAAPVLVAVVARIEQLRGQTLTTISWHQAWFDVMGTDADIVQSLAAEFSLCSTPRAGGLRFQVC